MSDELLERIRALELENKQLKQKLASVNTDQVPSKLESITLDDISDCSDEHLSLEEYQRYGRQMIVPQFGSLKSQLKLKKSKVLVIGAGGLGCPSLLYLSAAGVGKLGIIDNDVVDISNLHRQVLHTTESVGTLKCESAKKYIGKLNPNVDVQTYPYRLSNSNVFEIISQYDLVLDCTDTPSTRYLINDGAVLCGKTIISGSGLKSDGQLSILNFQGMGPCYRCFYPQPPSPESITTCSDGGVIGPCIGLIGVTMALEAIKVLTGFYTKENFKPFLSMYSGYPQQQIRVFKMRNKQKHCSVCGESPSITKEQIENFEINYSEFCGKVNLVPLDPSHRVDVLQFKEVKDKNDLLIDVRPKEQFEIVKLSNSINISWEDKFKKLDNIDSYLPDGFNKESDNAYVICRLGNDSQAATQRMINEFNFKNVKDVIGGLNAWSDKVDPKFPKY